MVKEQIIDEMVKIINMYFNNQDWQSYLEGLSNGFEVKQGIREVLEGIKDEKEYKN